MLNLFSNIRYILGCRVYLGRDPRAVGPGSIVLFPLLPDVLSCGLTGIVKINKASSGPAGNAQDAADALKLTAQDLMKLGVIDGVVQEPLGGAHRDYPAMMQTMKKALQDTLKQVQSQTTDEMLQARFTRLMSYGKFKEAPAR